MCGHIFCLPCILEKFKERRADTYLVECWVCRKIIFFAPKPEERLNVIASRIRSGRGMPIASTERKDYPFEYYCI